MARRCPPGGFGFGAVMRRVHATRARVPCTRLWEGIGGWVQGWGRERQPIGSRCYVRGARAAASRRREPHKNPKQRTLQPPTLNPSAVVVFSRCHREVRGDASHRGWSTRRCVPSSTTRRVVKMTEAGVHRPVRALRGSVRGRHLGGHVVARGGGWWARRPARADASVLWSMSQAPRPRT
jgi:hypothetical protein